MFFIFFISCSSTDVISNPRPLSDFHVGINYPWWNYGTDFGTSAWGDLGMEHQRIQVESDFQKFAHSGIEVVRWFVLCDGRSSPEFDNDGFPTILEEEFYDDLDTVLDVAEQNELYIVPVLFDFYWLSIAEFHNGTQMGGHADTFSDVEKKEALLERVITPILEHYGDHASIYAWDIINEPEHAMLPPEDSWIGDGVSISDMIDFVGETTDLIHQYTNHFATLGSVDASSLQENWMTMKSDVLQFHYYDDAPFDIHKNSFLDNRPMIVGEFSSTEHSVSTMLSSIKNAHFTGAWLWSYHGEDDHSNIQLEEILDWNMSQEN